LTPRDAHVGCSGWQYKHWRGVFYPLDIPQSRWLEYYSARFDTVEVNNSFYRLPEPGTFAAWKKRVPPGFIFAVKASRFLTHMKKLKDPVEPIDRLFSRARHLGAAQGPMLYQLPPRWSIDVERLRVFLTALPPRRLHTIEFRDPSWYAEEVFELLDRRGVALCLHDMVGSATGQLAVGPFIYVRFHGPAKYSGRYSDSVLGRWGEWLREQRRLGKAIYAYFNNDAAAQAPRDADRLRRVLTTD
jgi:uncharacterized protein YecE (DUF72 family)